MIFDRCTLIKKLMNTIAEWTKHQWQTYTVLKTKQCKEYVELAPKVMTWCTYVKLYYLVCSLNCNVKPKHGEDHGPDFHLWKHPNLHYYTDWDADLFNSVKQRFILHLGKRNFEPQLILFHCGYIVSTEMALSLYCRDKNVKVYVCAL